MPIIFPNIFSSSLILYSWSEDDALVVHKSVFRKRQRKVVENPEARDLREQNRQSQKEEAKRRQVLRERLAQNGSNLNDDRTKIIINESKHDHEGFVFVHEHIGQRIKSHQIEGTRFMWSQIVSKDDPKQGCLLAHTMGLGKTMQVYAVSTT
jgi:SNF2 family DNA or RNA helicase